MTTGYDVWLEEQHNNREVARLEVGGCMTTLVERLREAWKTSSENSLLISNAADEITRLNAALQWEQNRSERIGTHGPGCHLWGPSHHECLLRKFDQISRMESEHCAYLVQENERLNKLLEAKHYYHGGIGLNQLRQIEAQAAEIERQNATIDSYINTAAVLAAKVEAQSAEIERLKASFTNELDSLSNRNYQLRMANADQAALLKQCWGYFNEIRMNDDQNRWTCDQAIAAIEQYERGE